MIELYYDVKNKKYKYAKEFFEQYNIPFVEINLKENTLQEDALIDMMHYSEKGLYSIVKDSKIKILETLKLSEFKEYISKNHKSLKLPILRQGNKVKILESTYFSNSYDEIRAFLPRAYKKQITRDLVEQVKERLYYF